MEIFKQSTNGAAAVEFALILPIFFSVLVGVSDFGIAMLSKNDINQVVTTGFHYALIKNDNTADIETAMKGATALKPLTVSATFICRCAQDMTASCSQQCPDNTSPVHYVSLYAQTSFTPFFSLFLSNPFMIQSTAIVRVK